MPAVDLSRLKKQAAALADLFDQPEAFLRALHEMLDLYVNRTLRTKNVAAPISVLPSYRTPSIVLRQIENELNLIANRQPAEALILADELWDDGYLETRLLAAFLLGRIPPREERLLARLTAWTGQVRDPEVRTALLTTSLTRLRREAPDNFLVLVREWLHPAREKLWPNGIRALLALITDPDFENLPPVFEIVHPVIDNAPPAMQMDIRTLLAALYEASATETAYFLKQLIRDSQNPNTPIMLRRMAPNLPKGLADSIRPLVRAV
ncbi:MAG: DNA alkylation repair protein [Chloroflexota bacterium]